MERKPIRVLFPVKFIKHQRNIWIHMEISNLMTMCQAGQNKTKAKTQIIFQNKDTNSPSTRIPTMSIRSLHQVINTASQKVCSKQTQQTNKPGIPHFPYSQKGSYYKQFRAHCRSSSRYRHTRPVYQNSHNEHQKSPPSHKYSISKSLLSLKRTRR
jgi:hypothetical protein